MGLSQCRNRGFTLIELLVVIAIIGILSAVILASLNTARQKGSDASIESNLDTIRTQAELYYGDQPKNEFASTAATSCTQPSKPAGQTTNLFEDSTINQALNQVIKESGDKVVCHATVGITGGYAVSAPLIGQTGKYYCVDSTGAGTTTSKQTLSSSNDVNCN